MGRIDVTTNNGETFSPKVSPSLPAERFRRYAGGAEPARDVETFPQNAAAKSNRRRNLSGKVSPSGESPDGETFRSARDGETFSG